VVIDLSMREGLERNNHRYHLRLKKVRTDNSTEEEAVLKDTGGSLAWLRKEIEQAGDTDNPVAPTTQHVAINR